MGLQGIKAIFFDLDNTLIDTAAAGRRAIEEVKHSAFSCVGGGGRTRKHERSQEVKPD